jgi:hypothetical protein
VIPYIITSQESDDLRGTLKKKGIEFGWHLIPKKSQEPYVNSKLFAEYVESAFVPPRRKNSCQEENRTRRCHVIGRQLSDSPQVISDVMDLLNMARVRVVTFAPITTQIFQLLDLIVFEIFKHEEKYHLLFGDFETTVNSVYNTYIKMAKTLSLPNIWAAFQGIRVE